MSEMVFMTHPDAEALGGPVPKESFDSLWNSKGWELATPEQIQEAFGDKVDLVALGFIPGEGDEVSESDGDAEPQTKSLADMTRPELDELAARLGLDPSQFTNKADLITAIQTQEV